MTLRTEINRLNPEQREAVLHNGNTAVLAGPGSGKTATLVVKIAYLQAERLVGPEGIACITYNNDAVTEFQGRLAGLGIYSGARLFLGTVHSFCLNCVLRPFATLVRSDFASGIKAAKPKWAQGVLDAVISKHLPKDKPSWHRTTVTRFRRARACGEPVDGFDDEIPKVVSSYEQELARAKCIDFEAMVLFTLEILRKEPWVQDLVAARFPWLIVDEYQDLGGPLHQIVTTLMEKTDTRVFAVGDSDQTVYHFTGADPRYLNELANRGDVKDIRLKFNYRSGSDLIIAGQAALNEERGYAADPMREDRGRVEFVGCGPSLEDHAKKAVEAASQEINRETPAHEIAILYNKKNLLLAELRAAFDDAKIPYRAERDSRYPPAPLIRWLQHSAAWALHQGESHSLEELFRFYAPILEAAGQLQSGGSTLVWRTRLFETLDGYRDGLLRDWLAHIEQSLELTTLLRRIGDREDEVEAWDELTEQAEPGGLLADVTISEFASDGHLQGKVVITTFHSSKGRQFDVVVVPGLAEGILPQWRWNRSVRREEPPSDRELAEARRLFYVGFTRARHTVHLICSESHLRNGYLKNYGFSRYAREISERLKRDR